MIHGLDERNRTHLPPDVEFLANTLKRRIEGTYQTGQVIAGLTL